MSGNIEVNLIDLGMNAMFTLLPTAVAGFAGALFARWLLRQTDKKQALKEAFEVKALTAEEAKEYIKESNQGELLSRTGELSKE